MMSKSNRNLWGVLLIFAAVGALMMWHRPTHELIP
jgi:hypothetical protein